MTNIDLSLVVGGQSQDQLRALARRYCPQTSAQHGNRTITRPVAERCLREAGMEQYSSQLDRYFPR
jgi:hypothetical protein